MPARSCGSCSACCVVLGVVDLDSPKPENVACSCIRAGGGCSRYATRPPTCSGYHCGWLAGIGEDEDRPDRGGLILEPNEAVDGGEPLVLVREVWPGAFERPRTRVLLEPVLTFTLLCVMRADGSRALMGDPRRLAVYTRIIAASKTSG